VVPARVLETRPGLATVDGVAQGVGRRPADSVLSVPIRGRAGVPANASAVMLNVTAVNPAGGGFLTVYPCNEGRPVASNVNYGPGQVVPNAVLAKIGTAGDVCVYTLAESDILIDVSGFVPNGGTPATIAPLRALDTRPGSTTADGLGAGIGRRPAGSTTGVAIAGRLGVPSNAAAVMLNVTAVSPSAGGFITVFPCGADQPLASSLNYAPGQVVPNAVLSRIGAGGQVCVFTLAETDVIIDVAGFVSSTGTPTTITPIRLLETRPGQSTFDGEFQGIGRLAAGSVTTVQMAGRGIAFDATAVMLNVTAVNPSAGGFLTVYPCDGGQPVASNVNYAAGQVVPNATFSKLSAAGTVCIFTLAETDVIIDATGYVDDGS
jgi:hypothetical protein